MTTLSSEITAFDELYRQAVKAGADNKAIDVTALYGLDRVPGQQVTIETEYSDGEVPAPFIVERFSTTFPDNASRVTRLCYGEEVDLAKGVHGVQVWQDRYRLDPDHNGPFDHEHAIQVLHEPTRRAVVNRVSSALAALLAAAA